MIAARDLARPIERPKPHRVEGCRHKFVIVGVFENTDQQNGLNYPKHDEFWQYFILFHNAIFLETTFSGLDPEADQ